MTDEKKLEPLKKMLRSEFNRAENEADSTNRGYLMVYLSIYRSIKDPKNHRTLLKHEKERGMYEEEERRRHVEIKVKRRQDPEIKRLIYCKHFVSIVFGCIVRPMYPSPVFANMKYTTSTTGLCFYVNYLL